MSDLHPLETLSLQEENEKLRELNLKLVRQAGNEIDKATVLRSLLSEIHENGMALFKIASDGTILTDKELLQFLGYSTGLAQKGLCL